MFPCSGGIKGDAIAQLRSLSEIIKISIDKIESSVKANSVEYPSLDTLYSTESEAARNLPEVQEAGAQLVAAAAQLISSVYPPQVLLYKHSLEVCAPSAMMTLCAVADALSCSISRQYASALPLRHMSPRFCVMLEHR
jgi:hypothetical protein